MIDPIEAMHSENTRRPRMDPCGAPFLPLIWNAGPLHDSQYPRGPTQTTVKLKYIIKCMILNIVPEVSGRPLCMCAQWAVVGVDVWMEVVMRFVYDLKTGA